MERVSIRRGDSPLLIIAPHGADDPRTDFIAEFVADFADAYAVINRGWERAKTPDYFKDQANCNNIMHCYEDVVKEEFLNPILKFKNRIMREYGECFMFVIHGMGNDVRIKVDDPLLDIVLGYGAGRPPSYTCQHWMKDAFINFLDTGTVTYEAGAGTPYAGKNKNNLVQLFRSWFFDPNVNAMQIEIIRELRENDMVAKLTAEHIANCMERLIYLGEGEFNGEINTKIY